MKRILVFGNSGSGKTTLAKRLSHEEDLAHLDLDELAWLDTDPPERAAIAACLEKIRDFTSAHDSWIIEGCYTDLLELVSADATEIFYLNLPVGQCIENARNRPWEPHKYESREAQDRNLDMLLNWIARYEHRDDEFSGNAHLTFYNNFPGKKTMLTENQ